MGGLWTAVIVAALSFPCDTLSILPSDKRIFFSGRFDRSSADRPGFSWVMSGLRVSVSGTSSVFGTFEGPADGARLKVVVDGAEASTLKISAGGPTEYTLVKGLNDVNHTIEVYKITEDNAQKKTKGTMHLSGLRVDEGGSFDQKPKASDRRLEFIGDSDTAGWCADGSHKTGDNADKYQDGYETWAQQLARELLADTMVEAVSSWGVTSSSDGAIQGVLNNVNTFDTGPASWDYTSWTPDAVVILIGPNDEYSNSSMVHSKSFVKAYLSLLEMVANNYAKAVPPPKIIHVCGGSMNGLDPCDDIQAANTQFNAEGHAIRGYYTAISKTNWKHINSNADYQGCDSHYNHKGHQVLMKDILPQVKSIMGW